MRICIITPGHLSTNPRVVKEADALSEAGHQVSVVRGHFAPWMTDADRDIESSVEWPVKAVPFGPHLARKPDYVRQTLRRRVAQGLWRCGWRTAANATAAQFPAARELAQAALDSPADLYIAHYVAALPAAVRAAGRHGGRYMFDGEDFHPGDPPDGPEHDLERSVIDAVLTAFLPGAVGMTAASPLIAGAYAAHFGIPTPTVILNAFPEPPGGIPLSRAGRVTPGPSVYWVSQTIGDDRGLEEAVEACSMASSRPHLYLRGRVADDYRSRLEEIALQSGFTGRLHFLPLAPAQDLERLAAEFDLGLCSETGNTKNRDIALTNKLFSYLTAGIPTVMSDITAHRDLAGALGDACRMYRRGNPASLAAALDELLCDPKSLAAARATAHAAGRARFSWEFEKRRLVDFIEHTALHAGKVQCSASAVPRHV